MQIKQTLARWIKWLRQTHENIKREMEKPLDLFAYDNSQAKLKNQAEEVEG